MKHALAAIVLVAAFAPAFPAFPAPDSAAVRPIHRVDPEFPRWAFRAGVNRGIVSARVTVDADGRVTTVEIVNAEPKRLFDEAVVQALSQWRYVEGRAGRSIDVEIAFAR
jgi:protein TonB